MNEVATDLSCSPFSTELISTCKQRCRPDTKMKIKNMDPQKSSCCSAVAEGHGDQQFRLHGLFYFLFFLFFLLQIILHCL